MRILEGLADVDDVDGFVAWLAEIGDDHDATVQAFDARYVVDRAHLERALELADRAIERDEAIARDRGMEVLCYAAGRRQIERALEMGVGEGACPTVVLIDDGDEQAAAEAVAERLEPAEVLGDFDPETVREFFGVTPEEEAATDAGLPALVRERVALLVVEK